MAETFNRASAALTTSFALIYAAPTTTGDVSVVLSVLVANVDGLSGADVDLCIYDGATALTGGKLANTLQVPADSSVELIANKLVLKAGESLYAKASAAGDLEVTVSALEIT
tara:strand:- start:812 stop:1147 length:336 start_codon:yes stop_codon:yes gene_type:complete